MATPFEEFVNRELPRRSAHLTYAITGYDGDPNDGGAPSIIQSAPLGTWYHELSEDRWWRKGLIEWILGGGGAGSIAVTTSSLDMTVDPVGGTSPPAGTVITNQAEYDDLGYDLKYPQDAVDILPPILTNWVHVLLKAGTHYAKPGSLAPSLGSSAALFVLGKMFDNTPVGFFELVPWGSFFFTRNASLYFEGEWVVAEAAQGGSHSGVVLTRDSGTWTPDEHKDKFVRITSGAGAGSLALIRSNDADTLNLTSDPSSSGACQFEIIENGSIILSSTDGVDNVIGLSVRGPLNGEIWFDKVQFGTPTKRMLSSFVERGALATLNLSYYCRMYMGSTSDFPFRIQGAIWLFTEGLIDFDGTFSCIVNERSTFDIIQGVARGKTTHGSYPGLFLVNTEGKIALSSSWIEAQNSHAGSLVHMTSGTFAPEGGVLDGKSTSDGLVVLQSGDMAGSASLAIDNCGVAIDVRNGARFVTEGLTVSGSGNTTGWKLDKGADVSVDTDPSGLAATNEIDIDGEVLGYTEVPNPGDWIEGANGSRFIR